MRLAGRRPASGSTRSWRCPTRRSSARAPASPTNCLRSARRCWRAGSRQGQTPTDGHGRRLPPAGAAPAGRARRSQLQCLPRDLPRTRLPVTTVSGRRRSAGDRAPSAAWRHGRAASAAIHRRQAAEWPGSANSAARRVRCVSTRQRRRANPFEQESDRCRCPRLQFARRSSLRRREQHLVPRQRRRHCRRSA